jgi:hypothetical protein
MKHAPHTPNPTPAGFTPLVGNPAISVLSLIRGFASQSHDWFALIGEDSRKI